MNLLTLPLVNPRHHIGKLKGFAYLLFEAFMQAYMKFLYLSCLVRNSLQVPPPQVHAKVFSEPVEYFKVFF